MKVLHFLFCLTLLPNSYLNAQEHTKDSFTIQGTVIGKESGVVSLWYRDEYYIQRIKQLPLEKGNFSWSGSVKGACEALLWTDTANKVFDDPTVVRFLLEPGNVSIVFNSKDSTYAIAGSAAEKENVNWKGSLKDLLTAKATLRSSIANKYREQRLAKVNLEDAIKVLEARLDSVNSIIRNLDLSYIKAHPNSFLSAYLVDKQKRFFHLDTSIALYSKLSNEVKTSVLGFDVLSYVYPLTNDSNFRKENPLGDIAFTEKLLKIRSAYELSFFNTMGNVASLANYSGRPMILTFWASWCAPCKESMPEWNRLAERYKNSIQFVTVAVADNQTEWKKAIRDYKVKGDLLYSSNFNELAPVYCKVWNVPTYIFVNNEGQIINYDAPHPNDPAFKTMLDKLLMDNDSLTTKNPKL